MVVNINYHLVRGDQDERDKAIKQQGSGLAGAC